VIRSTTIEMRGRHPWQGLNPDQQTRSRWLCFSTARPMSFHFSRRVQATGFGYCANAPTMPMH